MTDKTSLGDRMKNYEAVAQSKLLQRTPVIIRVDGKAFHTFTKRLCHFNDMSLSLGPFSQGLHDTMTRTAINVSMQMQNAVFAYTQSDEISFLLRDWDKLTTQQWFDGKIQKIVSVVAGMTSVYFNFFLAREYENVYPGVVPDWCTQYPVFDARVFNLPKEEVTNYFIWRQKDATRNSIQMLGRHYFSHKQLHGKNSNDIQDMLMSLERYPVNWNDLETWKKRGTVIARNPNQYDSSRAYIADEETPVFTQDREYIEKHLEADIDD